MKTIQFLFLLSIFGYLGNAQKINEQFELKIENDKFLLVDRYYTGGHFLSYRKSISTHFIFKKKQDNTVLLNYKIGNEIYTPKNLSSFNTDDFDRPFAGWLFGSFEVGTIDESSAKFLTFETGITGNESLSGDLQVWFHEVLGLDNFTSWEEEIEFKWLFNFKYQYLRNWNLNERNTLQYEFFPAVGTKDIFLENNIHYFFGNYNELKNSSRLGSIDATSTKEFYGLISAGYRYVAHNTLIQGSIFKEDVLFTTDISHHIFKLKFGAVYKTKRNAFKLIYNFNSKETPLSTSHGFGTFIFSRDF